MKFKNLLAKAMFLLIVVAFVLGMFASGSVKAEAPGGLYCYQLVNCTGESGCSGYGSVNDCEIECQGGGTAICDEKPAVK
jgi:hypothetical protein